MPTTPTEQEWRRALEQVLERPLLVRPHFQPIVDLQSASICGYEALARFAELRGDAPAEWFAAADMLGYGPALEALIVRTVLAAHPFAGARYLSLNVSPRALVTAEVRGAFAERDDLGGIVVEITEQTDADLGRLAEALAPLRDRGARICVDDAAAGWGSLRRIAALRPDYVKVDPSVVRGVVAQHEQRAVVQTLVELAGKLGAKVLAGGIERRDELDALLGLGVHLGQGFELARPSPALAELAAPVVAALRARQGERATGELDGLLEVAPALPTPVAPEALRGVLAGDPRTDVVVLLDARARPTDLVLAEDGEEHVRTPLTLAPATSAADAMRAAMARPPHARFDPVVCCDAAGRYAGVVRLERLIAALSD